MADGDSAGALSIDLDMLTPFHSRYHELRADGVEAHAPMVGDCWRWLNRSLERLASARVNLVVEPGLPTRDLHARSWTGSTGAPTASRRRSSLRLRR
jgi:hypothetical protein